VKMIRRAGPLFGAAFVGASGMFAAQHFSTTGRAPLSTAAVLPKLTYFDGHGRAFVTRVALRKANVGYTDERLSFEDLEQRRGVSGASESVPLGQLPVLTLAETGMTHCQSSAIGRWAGKKAGLYPKNDDLALIVDDVSDSLEEMFSKLPREKDANLMKEKRVEFANTVIPKYMAHLNAVVKHSGGPYVLGKAPSLADLTVFRVVNAFKTGQIDHLGGDVMEKYPVAMKIYETVLTLPEVKAELAHQEALNKAKKKA